MLLAQVFIPAAVGFAIVAAVLLAVLALRGNGATPSIHQVQGTVLEGFEAFLGRTYLVGFGVAIVLALAAGGALGGHERSLETGALVGGALLVGALAAAIPGIAGSMILVRSSASVAGAAQAGVKRALVVALRGGGAAGVLAIAFAVGSVAGLFATYSAVLDKGPEDAPILILALAVGAASLTLVVHIVGGFVQNATASSAEQLAGLPEPVPLNDPRNPGVSARMVGTVAAGAGRVSDLFGLQVLGILLAVSTGAPLYGVTGEMGWLLLPLMVPAAGLAASALGLLFAGLWVRDSAAGATGAYWFAAVAGVGGAVALCFAAIEEEWWWFAGCVAAGAVCGAIGLIVGGSVGRVRSSMAWAGPTSLDRGFAASIDARSAGMRVMAAQLLVGGLALAGAFVLGEQGATRHIGDVQAGLYGVALAVTGALIPLGVVAAMDAAAAVAANGRSLALIAFDVTPESRNAAQVVDEHGHAGHVKARSHSVAVSLLAGVLAVTVSLQLVRTELGKTAARDPDRYATLVQDIGVAPTGRDIHAAISNAVRRYGVRLEEAASAVNNASRFGDREIERLAAAERLETEGRVGALLDRGGINARDLRDIEASPYPLPRLLPLSIGRIEVWAGLLAGFAMAAFLLSRVGGAASRVEVQVSEEVQRQFRDVAGVRTGEVRADYARASDAATRGAVRASLWPSLVAILLPALVGIGLRYAFGGEGNEGWLAAAGLVVGAVVGGVVVAAASGGAFASAVARRAEAEAGPGAEGVAAPPDAELVVGARTAERWAAHGVQCSAPMITGAARLSIAVALVLVPLMAG